MLARIRKSIQEKDAGFTLVELLVVMIIIGILASIAIPVFLNQRKKAVDTSIKSDLRSVSQEMETRFVDQQTYELTPAAPQDARTVFSTNNYTTGNVLQVFKSTSTSYCLRGSNPNGTATGAAAAVNGLYYWVDSSKGGLQAAASATAPTGGAC